jgi:hypothetical protein
MVISSAYCFYRHKNVTSDGLASDTNNYHNCYYVDLSLMQKLDKAFDDAVALP